MRGVFNADSISGLDCIGRGDLLTASRHHHPEGGQQQPDLDQAVEPLLDRRFFIVVAELARGDPGLRRRAEPGLDRAVEPRHQPAEHGARCDDRDADQHRLGNEP